MISETASRAVASVATDLYQSNKRGDCITVNYTKTAEGFVVFASEEIRLRISTEKQPYKTGDFVSHKAT